MDGEQIYWVYVLSDKSSGLTYVGMTNDITRRINEHRAGKTKTTRKMNNPEVVYIEKMPSRLEAHKREKYLKSSAGRRYRKKIGLRNNQLD